MSGESDGRAGRGQWPQVTQQLQGSVHSVSIPIETRVDGQEHGTVGALCQIFQSPTLAAYRGNR